MNERHRAPLNRWVWRSLFASAGVILTWLLWRPAAPSPAPLLPSLHAPAQQQPQEVARPTQDPELVS